MNPHKSFYSYPSSNEQQIVLPSLPLLAENTYYNHYDPSTIAPNQQKKIKLPSISNIRLFNFKPYTYNLAPPQSRQQLPVNCTQQYHHHHHHHHQFQNQQHVQLPITEPTDCTRFKPQKRRRLSARSPPKTPSVVTPRLSSSSSSKQLTFDNESRRRRLVSSKLYDLNSFSFKRKPPKFFPNLQIDSDFIHKNLIRDLKYNSSRFGELYKDKLNYANDENEIIIDPNDLIRWKTMDFFLDYLKMNDIRDEKASVEDLTPLERKNLFIVKINIELKSPDDDDDDDDDQEECLVDIPDNTPTKKLMVHLKAVKSDDSRLTKSEILETIEDNFDEFFINYETDYDKKKRRRSSIKPKWGLGYRDELSVILLNVEVEDINLDLDQEDADITYVNEGS